MISITWPQVRAMSPSREIAAHLTFPLCSLVTIMINLVLPVNHHELSPFAPWSSSSSDLCDHDSYHHENHDEYNAAYNMMVVIFPSPDSLDYLCHSTMMVMMMLFDDDDVI